MQKTISIIVPVYNEEKNIPLMYNALKRVFSSMSYKYEFIFVNDGSHDGSQEEIEKLANLDPKVKILEFSRNFGKEAATTAGFHHSTGDAVMAIDADMQHPPELIPQFIKRWEEGKDVVIGVRTSSKGQTWFKTGASFLYYKLINAISSTPIQPRATDFRLLDRKVVNEFNKLTEHERITRGLIDWLGFRRSFIEFDAQPRANGEASYSIFSLYKLAISSTISHSLIPLKIAGYIGIFIVVTSGIGGMVIFIQRYIFGDVLGWSISGTGQLAILLVFFTGIILMCLGLIALYIGNIHHEVAARPLYVVRSKKNLHT